MNKGAILMKDVVGVKASTGLGSKMKAILVGPGPEQVNVPRGRLVVIRNQEEEGHMPVQGRTQVVYQLCSDPEVTVLCTAEDVSPLSEMEFLLLAAIKSREDRYQAFVTENCLEWGTSLKCGDYVSVKLPSTILSSTDRAVCVIWYVGELPKDPGIHFGVEIKEGASRGKGYTNGEFQGTQYFKCEENCGMFVSLEKMSPIAQAGIRAAIGNLQNSRRVSQEVQSSVTANEDLPVKRGDRVVVHNKNCIACRGTVKWIRKHAGPTGTLNYPIAGLEMDERISDSDFENSIAGMTHLIQQQCKRSHVLFLPASLLTVVADPEQSVTGKIADEFQMSRSEVVKQQKDMMKEAKKLAKAQKVDPSSKIKGQHHGQHGTEKEINQTSQRGHNKPLRGQPHSTPRILETATTDPLWESQAASSRRGLSVDHYEPTPGMPGESGRAPGHYAYPHSGASNQFPPPHGSHFSDPANSRSTPGQRSPAVGSTQPPIFPPSAASSSAATYGNLPLNQSSKYPSSDQHLYDTIPESQPQGYPPSTVPSHFIVQPPNSPASQPQGYPPSTVPSHFTVQPPNSSSHPQLELGSLVEIDTDSNPRHGVIRWIGHLPSEKYAIAGVELDDDLYGCTDGVWQKTGQRFFVCTQGRALFCPLVSLKPDTRFGQQLTPHAHQPGSASATLENPLKDVPEVEEVDQAAIPAVSGYIGSRKGIQGHQNSCYLDATVFGLFALSDVFDSLFLAKSKEQNEEKVRSILWKNIVNPLRRSGTVRYESVMKLRQELDKLGKLKGLTQDEKDPEEFLNMLFKHTLHVKPFVKIHRPQGEEGEFFIQLFMEPFEGPRLPNIEDLLRKMFIEQNIKFSQVPSKLLIQVPRYGKQFKAFEKIIPNQRMSIDDLSSATDNQSKCFICGDNGIYKCEGCKTDFHHTGGDHEIYFCAECNQRAHKHQSRAGHHSQQIEQEAGSELELLSVICIETSHYVCFSRTGHRWIFMDSMADRIHDTFNIPKGVDVTRQLNEWVYSGDEDRLKHTPVRKLPEYVRRFTQDIYMCIYIQPDIDMYGDNS